MKKYILEDCRGNIIISSNSFDECKLFAEKELEECPWETYFINTVEITEEYKIDCNGIIKVDSDNK